ncbi:uncharacterized protein METZ01_LOCUS48867, partial [marine metagenome]
SKQCTPLYLKTVKKLKLLAMKRLNMTVKHTQQLICLMPLKKATTANF